MSDNLNPNQTNSPFYNCTQLAVRDTNTQIVPFFDKDSATKKMESGVSNFMEQYKINQGSNTFNLLKLIVHVNGESNKDIFDSFCSMQRDLQTFKDQSVDAFFQNKNLGMENRCKIQEVLNWRNQIENVIRDGSKNTQDISNKFVELKASLNNNAMENYNMLESLRKELRDLKRAYEFIKEENDKNKQEIIKERSEREKIIRDLMDDHKSMCSKQKNQKEVVEEMERKIINIGEQMNNNRNKISELEKSNEKMSEQLQRYAVKVDTLRIEIKNVKSRADDMIKDLKNKNIFSEIDELNLTRNSEKFMEELSQVKNEIGDEKKKREKVERKVEDIINKEEKNRYEISNNGAKFNERFDKVEDSYKNLSRDLSSLDTKSKTLCTDIIKIKEQLNKVEKTLNSLNGDLSKFKMTESEKRALEEVKIKVESIKEESKSLENEINRAKDFREQEEKTRKEFRDDVSKKLKNFEDKINDIEVLKEEIKNLPYSNNAREDVENKEEESNSNNDLRKSNINTILKEKIKDIEVIKPSFQVDRYDRCLCKGKKKHRKENRNNERAISYPKHRVIKQPSKFSKKDIMDIVAVIGKAIGKSSYGLKEFGYTNQHIVPIKYGRRSRRGKKITAYNNMRRGGACYYNYFRRSKNF